MEFTGRVHVCKTLLNSIPSIKKGKKKTKRKKFLQDREENSLKYHSSLSMGISEKNQMEKMRQN
jgi:hypothetical protein